MPRREHFPGGKRGIAVARYPIPTAGPNQPHCTELLIRRSRFLAQCAHTPGPEAARAFVESIRRANADATHNCWAYVAGAPGHTARIGSSDDGEPHGTAGRPMLQVLLHCGIGEICVVVTRWFGGVKLGTGGLVRAYQDSVRENLAGLTLAEQVPLSRLECTMSYAHLDALRRLLPAFEARVEGEDYQAEVRLCISLPEEQAAAFCRAVAGASNGAALCRTLETEANAG